MKTVERQSNIELLRIILMLMIITHHVIVHGLGLKNIGLPSFFLEKLTYVELAINSFVIIAVNTFIFISGYFGMKFKIRTVLSFIFQAIFYSVILYLLFAYIYPSQWSFKNLIRSFFPISRNVWWFISTYLGLYFISPFLNKGIDDIDRYQMRKILLGLLFLNCFSGFLFGTLSQDGYSIFHFIVIYILGRYIAKYEIDLKKRLLPLSVQTFLLFCSALILIHFHKLVEVWHLFQYNNPILIISSILFFFVFKNISIKSNKFINIIAGSVLGIYMIHDYLQVRESIAQLVDQIKLSYMNKEYLLLIFILILILSVFIVGVIIELIRKKMFDRIGEKLATLFKSNKRAQKWVTSADVWYKNWQFSNLFKY